MFDDDFVFHAFFQQCIHFCLPHISRKYILHWLKSETFCYLETTSFLLGKPPRQVVCFRIIRPHRMLMELQNILVNLTDLHAANPPSHNICFVQLQSCSLYGLRHMTQEILMMASCQNCNQQRYRTNTVEKVTFENDEATHIIVSAVYLYDLPGEEMQRRVIKTGTLM